MYFLIIVLVLAAIYWYCRRNNLPPGPWGLPVVGYLPWLDAKAPYKSLTTLAQKYGKIYGLYLGSVYTVVLSDYQLIRKFLAKDVISGRAPLYVTHGIMGGYGLICAEGDLWKNQRKFVSNCLKQIGGTKFSLKRNKMESLIMSKVEELIEDIKNQKQNNNKIVLDPLEVLRHSLGSILCLIVFGQAWSKDDETWKWLQYLQEEGTKHIGVAGPLNFLPFLSILPNFKKTMKFLLDGKHETHKLYQNIIDEQSEILEKKKSENGNVEADNIIQAFLLEREEKVKTKDGSEKYYSDQQFYHLLADIFGAGLDTTLTTMRWYLLFMAAYPNVQTKVQEELDNLLQGRLPDLEDLCALPLTEASLAEAQRIRSVVPVGIPHGALLDSEISDYRIPKGSMIMPLQWALHMDPHVWSNPETFEPTRFLDNEGRFFKPSAFMPFQTGKRMCVGDELAKMFLYLFCATIIQQFQISSEDELDLEGECGITLTPKPQKLLFTVRNV